MAQIILLSGGMDSLISYRLFYPNAVPVFVWTGSRYSHLDFRLAKQQVPELKELHLGKFNELDNGVVPHRNCILIATVANLFDAHELIVSAPRGELIWDQQRAFHRTMEEVLRSVKVTNPLRKLTKTQAVAAWLARGLPRSELLASRSCYSGELGQCGKCAACVKRWVALTNNGIQESYRVHPRHHAEELAESGSVLDLFRYGLRPAWEAWEALRR